MRELVKFKGNRDGLTVVLNSEGNFQTVLKELMEKLAAADSFLAGSEVSLDLGSRDLQLEQLEQLKKVFELNNLKLRRIFAGPGQEEGVLAREREVRTVEQEAARIPAGWQGRKKKKKRNKRHVSPGESNLAAGFEQKGTVEGEAEICASQEEVGEEDHQPAKDDIPVIRFRRTPRGPRADIVSEEQTILVQRTIRSGQRVYYPGNVVVLGDVNPGGEVVAGGNIIVMGSFRGVAHAGALGNEKAVVAAFRLEPSQLRIAGYITRAPEGDFSIPHQPEIARVQDGIVIIEQYQPGYERYSREQGKGGS
ncbi:MAG: septum site-determining protein MinC [Bacillota bacterium]|nr:septum site-determining protein MinC [Bacillota bacterium]